MQEKEFLNKVFSSLLGGALSVALPCYFGRVNKHLGYILGWNWSWFSCCLTPNSFILFWL